MSAHKLSAEHPPDVVADRRAVCMMYAGYYFTGDGARRDKDGYYWITGQPADCCTALSCVLLRLAEADELSLAPACW